MIHHALSGMLYPAEAKDILQYAINKGESSGTIDLFAKLPAQTYNNESAILEELSKHINIQ